jgi:protein ImuB
MVWCPDWPIVAAEIVEGVPASGAVAVLRGNRVLACSEAARADGVRRGLRRREAQSRCPQLVVVEDDPGRDARAFEPVVAAIEEVAVGVEVIRAGACAVAARGPVRYFGGEEAAAERIVEQIAQACAVESQVGVADGVFGAGLAARTGQIVAAGQTREFLAGVAVEALERPELADLLRRLGVKTLGDFAALPASDVLSRFGFDGALAHRLAAGLDHRPLAVRRPPPDLEVAETYEEPLERVDVAAFAGRVLAERLHERLAAHGLACTRLGIEAVTADGQELHRVWRHDGTLTAAAIAERVRWQLDGWLTGARRGAPARPTAGLVRLRLVPDGVLVHLGLQPGLWGDAGAERERAHRAMSRVQGLLGPDAVLTAVPSGGRSADDRIRLVPWGDERTPARPAADPADPIPGATVVPVQSAADAPPSILGPDPAAGPILTLVPGPAEAEEGMSSVELTPRRDRPALALVPGVPPPAEPPPASPTPPRKNRPLALVPPPEPPEQAPIPLPEPPEQAPIPLPASAEQAPAPLPEQTEQAPVRLPEPAPVRKSEATSRADRRRTKEAPWPGRLPKPSPALVLPEPIDAVVLDRAGAVVGVSARLELTGSPALVVVGNGPAAEITGWAGPWPVDERWWDPAGARRRARFQIGLADGRALLMFLAAGRWTLEAIYD